MVDLSANLAELEELRLEYLAAEKACLTGQTYAIEGISVTRPDLETVIARRKEIEREISNIKTALQGGRPGILTPKWS